MKTVNRYHKFASAAFTVLAIGLVALSKQPSKNQPETIEKESCIVDNSRHYLAGIVRFLDNHPNARKVVTASNSFLMDLAMLTFFLIFIIEGIQPLFISNLFFYSMRISCFPLAGKWPLPSPYYFADPGVPSIFVPYIPTHDLYFSGHVGNATITCTLAYYFEHYGLANGALLLVTCTFFYMIAIGGHFTNDLIIGMVAGCLASKVGILLRHVITYAVLKGYCLILSTAFNVKNMGKRRLESKSFLSSESETDGELETVE